MNESTDKTVGAKRTTHRITVGGSRSFKNTHLFNKLLTAVVTDILPNQLDGDIVFISGGSSGPDAMVIDYAKEHGYLCETIPAEWDNLSLEPCKIKTNATGKEYNALAGFARNCKMLDQSTYYIAFWDGVSPGTKHAIEYAKKIKLPYIIFIVEGSIHE